MTELRVYLPIGRLMPQFAAYLSTPTRARGYPPMAGDTSLVVEVSPALAIHRIVDFAVKASPELEPGLLYTERQFGVLELHSHDPRLVEAAGDAVLRGLDTAPDGQRKPSILFADIIDQLSDQHAIILNRTREASMILPGESLLVFEVEPALFAAFAANEAERAAPAATLVDVQMIGASGRIFMAGRSELLRHAETEIRQALSRIEGR